MEPSSITDGNPNAPIWIIGEAPGRTEIEYGRPFVGASGIELDKMLAEAGIRRSDCFLTNVCHTRPPSIQRHGKWINDDIDQFFLTKTMARRSGVSETAGRYPDSPIRHGVQLLHRMLSDRQPVLTIALGNTALWALTGHYGISKWRGSVFDTSEGRDKGPASVGGKVIATWHPADVLREWTHRPIVVQDLRRAAREAKTVGVRKPTWNFTIPASLSEVYDWFGTHAINRTPLICDTEGWGRVDCIGFAASPNDAICIPFKHETGDCESFWSAADEYELVLFLRDILTTHDITFHNALWDCQVIARRWGFLPRLRGDTQVMQHVCFPGLLGGRIDPVSGKVDKKGSSLSLSFIASMYCEYYRYWKDDGRHFDSSVGDERDYWRYNCEDCIRTFECATRLSDVIDTSGLRSQYEFLMREFGPVFAMMFRGLRYNKAAASSQRTAVLSARDSAKRWLDCVTDTDFNPKSAPQCKALFYDDLHLPPILNRDTKAPTLNDAALDTIARRHPLLRPLVSQIQNYRTLDTIKSDLDPDMVSDDGRLRTALNVAFVETFRFSSNATAFGEGGNIQNIKRPDDE